MSGFAGIVRPDGGTPDSRLLDRMAEHLAFRGPHGTQVWTRPGAGFCFTLLRTGPSPQAATQPCSLDGRVWLLGDVRLDGRAELRRRLEQFGDTPSPDATNEELILLAWRRWADQSFELLIGDFSFALWDAETKELWCVRDLPGAKPFFYAHSDSQLAFSNTLNVVRLVPEVSAKLDHHFIGDFLLQAWCLDVQRTAFLDIRRLPPGHALKYSNGEVSVRRYATLPIEEPLRLKRREEYVEQFRGHLEEAVRDRLPEGPAGILMSGGLDSTSVAAVAKKVQDRRGIRDSLHAYSVDCNPLFDDEEGRFASLAAKHIGIPIDILSGASSLPFAGWDEPSVKMPEPCCEPFLAQHLEHYRLAATRASVILSGDGGDDIMTGRAWPYLVYLLARGRLDSIALAFGGYVLRHGRFPPLRAGIRTRLRRLLGREKEVEGYPEWIEPEFEREMHLRDRWLELQRPAEAAHPLHASGHSALNGAYWSTVFECEDAACTGAAVETRAPLLDQRLVRFLLRVPPVPWCMNKELLREAMRDLLPEAVRLRPKTPLQGDPLLLHAEKNEWKPTLADGACSRLRMFVDYQMFRATSQSSLGLPLWADVRPIALDYWLKSVEKNEGIQ